jgi:hypothetical protein
MPIGEWFIFLPWRRHGMGPSVICVLRLRQNMAKQWAKSLIDLGDFL